MSSVPCDLGYRMPAEWEPHAGTWMSWPHKRSSWPGRFERIPPVFASIAAILSRHESVHINVQGEGNVDAGAMQVRELLRARGADMNRIRCYDIPTDDAWCRDHGPTFVIRREGPDPLAAIDWKFNSWGEKYPPYERDDQVPARVATELSIPRFEAGIVMEGGAFDVDGRGTLLTTESCLLHPNRNPGLDRRQIETVLREHLSISRVLWLGAGIAGDDTDGHVDDVARFVNPSTIVVMVPRDPRDINHAVLEDNRRRLEEMRTLDGRPYEIVPLALPEPIEIEGERVPCSYANFYLANGVVLVPTFGVPEDRPAIETLAHLFPARRVHGIDCRDLIWGLGAIHCVTQQVPAAPSR